MASFALLGTDAEAVMLFGTDNPDINTTAPDETLAGSGWQFEGRWGPFLGTAIAPQFFVSAKHIGNAGNSVFTFQNVDYEVVSGAADPYSDLVIWRINGTFPEFAPLYTASDEPGKHLVVIGRGTQRGSEVVLNNTARGWNWGAADYVQRWGENDVAKIVTNSSLGNFLYVTFDKFQTANESHLSTGDSGGAVFIQQNSTWKLAGINYAVDDLFTTPSESAKFNSAIYDARGYYDEDAPDHFVLIDGANPVPTGFYSTRISSNLGWIYSVIDPNGDIDSDGVGNLLQYALSLNLPRGQGYGSTSIASDNGTASLTYRKISNAPQLQYEVQQSLDLVSWLTVATEDQIIATSENVQTIKASVAIDPASPVFLRLRITKP
jgi:hypothetical protein